MSDDMRPRRALPPNSPDEVGASDEFVASDTAQVGARSAPQPSFEDSWFRVDSRNATDPAHGSPASATDADPELEHTIQRRMPFEPSSVRAWADDREQPWQPADLPPAEPPAAAAESPTSRRPEHAGSAGGNGRRTLRASLLLTLASAVLPGSGLLGAAQPRLRILGGAVAGLSLVGLVAAVALGLSNQVALAKFATSASGLATLTIGLGVFAVIWVALIAATHIATRPRRTTAGRKILGAALVTALAFGVSAPSAVAARYALSVNSVVNSVLPDAKDIKASSRPTLSDADPWDGIDRVNVLLLGADGDASRASRIDKYGIRTDTIMVASINTKTGDTTIIQIPRNVQFTPFPKGSEMAKAFPNGFRGDIESDFWVNGIWEAVTKRYTDIMGDVTYPGAEALKQGIQGITGLKMDYFVMLNIDGLKKLIDAMGGVTVNINEKLAIGGSHEPPREPQGYLTPGPDQKLDGWHAMWYARSRYNTDDYNRMARQSCLVNAVIRQANPQTLLTNFEPIAAASADLLTTDIPKQDLSAFIDLAFRVKDAKVNRLVFTNGSHGYSYSNPDFAAMRASVAKAIGPKSSSPKATSTKKASTATTTTSTTENVSDACSYTGE